jgi:hypothetical protein
MSTDTNAAPFPTAPPASALQETSARGFSDGLATARESWVRSGLDPAAFDAAAVADGLAPTAPPPADVTRAYSDFNLPIAPAPGDYKPNYGAYAESRPAERVAATNAEMTGWTAAMGFSPSMGAQVIELLVDLGQRNQAMTPEAREAWVAEQDRLALRLAGSETAVAELRARALAALDIAKGNTVSRDLAASPVALKDFLLVSLLANHTATLELFDKMHPGVRKRR